MAVRLTADWVEAVLQGGSSDLKFLSAREVFSGELQAKFVHVSTDDSAYGAIRAVKNSGLVSMPTVDSERREY